MSKYKTLTPTLHDPNAYPEYKSLTESDKKARKKVIAETILRELRKEKHE